MNFYQEDLSKSQSPFHIEKNSCTKNNAPLHKHDFIELIYVTKGTLKIYADYKLYTLTKGDAIFINFDIAHFLISDDEKDNCFIRICFLPEIIHTYGEDFFNAFYFFWLKANINNRVHILKIAPDSEEAELFFKAYKIFTQKEFGYEFSLISKLILICVNFFEKTKDKTKNFLPKISNSNSIAIKNILNEIEKTYSQVSVSEFASNYALPHIVDTKQFNETIGCSYSKYLEYYRIKQAMFMLATSSSKITEIAYSIGFADSAYFSKLFYNYTGFTPSAFKKNQHSDFPVDINISTEITKDTNDISSSKRLFYNTIFLACYYDNSEGAKGWSNNDFFDIIYADIGKINIDLENEHYTMSEGDILIICPNEKFRIMFTDNNKTRILRLQFYADILNIGSKKSIYFNNIYEYTKNKGRLFEVSPDDTDILNSLVSLYNERFKFEPSSEVIMRAHITNILSFILNKQHSIYTKAEEKKDNKTLAKLKEIINYIDTHYAENLSLKSIANQYYISYSHLSRCFKEITNTNFNSYLNNKRLTKARFLLATTNYSINEIASTLGFCSSSRFIENFTKRFKLSPLEFRKRFKTKDPLA